MESEELIITLEQLDALKHALGGKQKQKLGFRNYYYSNTPSEILEDLVSKELMSRHQILYQPENTGVYYRAIEKGCRFLGISEELINDLFGKEEEQANE